MNSNFRTFSPRTHRTKSARHGTQSSLKPWNLRCYSAIAGVCRQSSVLNTCRPNIIRPWQVVLTLHVSSPFVNLPRLHSSPIFWRLKHDSLLWYAVLHQEQLRATISLELNESLDWNDCKKRTHLVTAQNVQQTESHFQHNEFVSITVQYANSICCLSCLLTAFA